MKRFILTGITTRHLLGGRRRKTTPLPNQNSNRTTPDYQTGAKFISYKTIPSAGQRNSSVTRLYFPENKTRIPRLYFPQKEYELLGYKTLLPRGQQYEFTNLYYLRYRQRPCRDDLNQTVPTTLLSSIRSLVSEKNNAERRSTAGISIVYSFYAMHLET